MDAATGCKQSTIIERIGRAGNRGYRMVPCCAGTDCAVCGSYGRPAMDPSGPSSGRRRITVWHDDRSRVSNPFSNQPLPEISDPDSKWSAAGGELWVESSTLSRGGPSRLPDPGTRGAAGLEGTLRLG